MEFGRTVREDDLSFLPALELARLIRARELSPREVIEACLSRIDRVNPAINAFTVVLEDGAAVQARRAERQIARQEDTGILHGVPVTIKDLTDTAGIRTTYGSRAYADHVPDRDAVIVQRLLGAGAIMIGKTTTPELGSKGTTESLLHGVTNNPWRLTHTAGGSSGGAAAAVAAGLGPLAQGSDGGGSIRIPASCCGVVGLKPSFGRVPFVPEDPAYETTTHQGPLTRTVGDAALMLSAIAGPLGEDPFALHEGGIDFTRGLASASVRGLRVAYCPRPWGHPVDEDVMNTIASAARTFADLGAVVEEDYPDVADPETAMLDLWSTAIGRLAEDLVLGRVPDEDIDPIVLDLHHRGTRLSAFDYYRSAVVFRDEFYRGMASFFYRHDFVITPTIATVPFPHPGSQPGPSSISGTAINRLLGWVFTYPFNLTGHPAISIPCGFSSDGLPIGLQIVGQPHADYQVLQAAAAFEAAVPWAHRRPPLS